MSRNNNKKIIITGATGFIGRNLAEALSEDGMHIVATGRNEDVGNILKSRGIKFNAADITSSFELENAFCKVDCVIHCAAKAGDWGKFKEFHNVNVEGTKNLIKACRTYNIRKIIFISTPSVYVDGKDKFNINENELPECQLTHYSKTKLIAERDILSQREEGIESIIFRPRAVYGLYDNNFVPRILRMAQKKKFPLIAGGRALIDATYVINLIDIIRAALVAPPKAWNQAYNVSNGDPVPIHRWFELMLKVLGKPFNSRNVPEIAAWSLASIMELAAMVPFGPRYPLMTRFSVRYMASSMTLSIQKANKELNYRPKYSTENSFLDYASRISK